MGCSQKTLPSASRETPPNEYLRNNPTESSGTARAQPAAHSDGPCSRAHSLRAPQPPDRECVPSLPKPGLPASTMGAIGVAPKGTAPTIKWEDPCNLSQCHRQTFSVCGPLLLPHLLAHTKPHSTATCGMLLGLGGVRL